MRHKLSLIILLSVLCSLFLVLGSQCSAQETLTITTYYPSPYGSYNQLQTNSLGVGDNDGDGTLDSGDVPTTAGDVWVRDQVGIGTTSPTGLLQVGDPPTPGLLVTTGGNVGIGTTRPLDLLQVGTRPAPGLLVTAGGIVGIGTAFPAGLDKLEVQGGLGNAILGKSTNNRGVSGISNFGEGVYGSSTTSNGVRGVSISDRGVYGSAFSGTAVYGESSGGVGGYFSSGSGYALITGTGNVGIGTANPGAKLEVGNLTSNQQGFSLTNSAGTSNIFMVPQLGSGRYNPLSQAGDSGIFYNDTYGLVIGPSSTTESVMRIDSLGNVGIARNPISSSRLTVGGPTYIDLPVAGSALEVRSGGADDPTQGGQIKLTNTYSGVPTPNKHIRVDSLGRFQIINSAYTAPILTLDNNGNLSIPGNLYAASCCPSDVRFKENIRPLKSSLDKIIKIRGVSFKWKKDKSFFKGKHYGVIAQEVEKVFPEIVGEGPEGIKTVSYTELIPILIEAVKELKAENEAQEARIKALEKKE